MRSLSVTDNSWAVPPLRVIVTQLVQNVDSFQMKSPLAKGEGRQNDDSRFALQGVVLLVLLTWTDNALALRAAPGGIFSCATMRIKGSSNPNAISSVTSVYLTQPLA